MSYGINCWLAVKVWIVYFRLSMECMDEEGMRYRSAMSDLMLDSQGNVSLFL